MYKCRGPDYMQKENPDPQSATTSSGSQPKSLVTFYPKWLGHHSQKQPAPYCVSPLPTQDQSQKAKHSPLANHIACHSPFWFACLQLHGLQSGHTLIDPSLYPLQSFPTLFAFESLPKASDGADSLAVQQTLNK